MMRRIVSMFTSLGADRRKVGVAAPGVDAATPACGSRSHFRALQNGHCHAVPGSRFQAWVLGLRQGASSSAGLDETQRKGRLVCG